MKMVLPRIHILEFIWPVLMEVVYHAFWKMKVPRYLIAWQLKVPSKLYIIFRTISVYYQRRRWHPTPVLLPGKSHARRGLIGCSPWGRWESGTTERLHFHFSLSCIGEENGNPRQYSCLENPRDRGAWWAAICGVAQSRTRLKWLNSSSREMEK